MNSYKISKINRLLRDWPVGTVATSSWLASQGVYQQLSRTYEKSGWIQRIGHGAFIRWGDQVSWVGGVYALQKQLGLFVYVASKSALEMSGLGHFLKMGKGGTISLFGKPGKKLPLWFTHAKWGLGVSYKTPRLFDGLPNLAIMNFRSGQFEVKIATPERAMMEMLYLVPAEQDLQEASLIMEGLGTLRPKLVQELLEKCLSVKVKRLFLALAERCQHTWVKKLDVSKINLGHGKRLVAVHGILDKKYQITLPKPERSE